MPRRAAKIRWEPLFVLALMALPMIPLAVWAVWATFIAIYGPDLLPVPN